ncbi:MAG: hemolysin III family protein [Flammeovirgaceae bacterium]
MAYIQTLGEEIANAITHGIGFLLSIAALVLLLYYGLDHQDYAHSISFTVYGVSMMILYAASTLYHSFQKDSIKNFFQIVDHAAIYVMIAGSYTPFTLLVLKGILGWTLLGIVWGMTLVGIIFKIFFTGRFKILSTSIYGIMGWLVIFFIKPLLENLPDGAFFWLLLGGISYSIGIIFYLWEKLPYSHTIWHLFILGGSICHFFCIFLYLI